MTVSAVMILIFMSWLIQRLILTPLAQINRAIMQAEHQDNFYLPILPDNEIGFLGTTFDRVFKQLKTYKNRELEIAERKYIEIAKRYKLATSAAKIWVWDWQIEADIFLLETEMKEWLGYTNMEFSSSLSAWSKYIYIDDQVIFLRLLQDHLDGKTSEFSCEHRLVKADGAFHWFLSRGKALQHDGGKAFRAIGTITDIAERKQAEAELKQTNEELIRANRLKNDFLATMSHELRTPLNVIIGMTEGLQEKVFGDLNENQITALETIGKSSAHLLYLINDILDIAKIESGQLELNFATTDIAKLCQSSLAFIKLQALEKWIKLEIKLPPELPNLLIDERRIFQVLINLLDNAVKFTPSGGRITLEVSSKTHSSGQNYLRIAIIDTGIGIAPENINKLFQPFSQIDSSLNRKYQGTGLGLALVKKIVEAHGGEIHLTSEVGISTCFMIDLPGLVYCSLAVPLETHVIPRSEIGKSETVISPLILLVEENEANISTISSYLKAKGYQLLLAKNAQEGIGLAHSQPPNLILMDISIPEIDGIETIQNIRRDPSLVNIPIIALTTLAMTSDRELCLAAGANDYLSKPVKMKQLVTTIQQLL